MEKYYSIPTSDGYEIQGILNWTQETERLIIFVHGFTGSTNEAHYVGARDYFTKRGFATFRLSLYHGKESARKLHNSTIHDHNIDVQNVVDYFENNYSDIILIGHSLGGPSILGIEDFSSVNRIVLWDPALEMQSSAEKIFEKNGRFYTSTGSGKHIQVSKEMLYEFKEKSYFEVLQSIDFKKENLSIIYATEDRHIGFKPKVNDLGIKNDVIEGADHCFTRQGDLNILFEKTLGFIESKAFKKDDKKYGRNFYIFRVFKKVKSWCSVK